MKIAIVQSKPHKGQLEHNLEELGAIFAQLSSEPAPYDLVVLPEAALTGYFLEGGVYELARPAEVFAGLVASRWRTAAPGHDVDLTIGFYENALGTYHNSSLYLEIRGDAHRIAHVHRKLFLPTYGVFDEERFLSRGRDLRAFDTRFGRVAMLICEDVWHAIVPTLAVLDGARYLIVPSASPGRGIGFRDDGGEPMLESVAYWRDALRLHAAEHGVFILYAGLAGFEGGKGMTGSSCVVDPSGRVVATAPMLGAAILRVSIDPGEIDLARAQLPLLGDLRSVLPDLLPGLLEASRRR